MDDTTCPVGSQRPPWYVRRSAWLGVLTVSVFAALLCEAKLWRPGAVFAGRENVQITEARAWWDGRTDLSERTWDTAYYRGRVYSHFPPAFTFVSAALVPVFGGVPHWFVVLVIGAPVVLLAYRASASVTRSPVWGAVCAVGLVCGSSLWPVLEKTLRSPSPYFMNQTLGATGLLLLAGAMQRRRRAAFGAAGLLLSAWSRQLTLMFAVPLVWQVWRDRSSSRAGRVIVLAAPIAAVGGLMTLNTIKFGNPLESGYRYLYADRPADDFSRDADAHGLFSPAFVPRNLYYTNIGLPNLHKIEVSGRTEYHLRPNRYGTGIWWTTPFLCWLFVDLKRLWRDPEKRVWLLAAAGVFAALSLYHSTGFEQRGFNRYSLDYLPILFVLVADRAFAGRRKWVSLVMVVWSVVYFRWLI